MKTKMKIFNVVFGVLICLAPVGVHAATVEFECGYFNPAFGLCSTHSHNIGATDSTTNLPVNLTKSEEVAQMNDVIALKSTVIAQQLKEQYDALNAIIKRFKTQLEKAVLTSKIEVLTGNSASGNSGGGLSSASADKGLANANNCSLVEYDKVFDCLMGNLQKVQQVATSDTTNARYQLDKDLNIIDMYSMCTKQDGNNTVSVQCSDDSTQFNEKCGGDVKKLNGRKIPDCATWLYAQVNMAKNKYNQQSRSYNQRGW